MTSAICEIPRSSRVLLRPWIVVDVGSKHYVTACPVTLHGQLRLSCHEGDSVNSQRARALTNPEVRNHMYGDTEIGSGEVTTRGRMNGALIDAGTVFVSRRHFLPAR